MMDTVSKLRAPWRWRGGLLTLAVIIFAIDQFSKSYMRNWLRPHEPQEVFAFFKWVLVYNQGAAFSFLSDGDSWQKWLLIGISVLVSLWLVTMILRLRPGERLVGYGYALILGGALGNLWDRMMFGRVTDFILLHYENWYFPAFNIADCAITFGALCLLLAIFVYPPHKAA